MAEHVVRAMVAGTVWKIEAAIGAAVGAEETILIIESMKMEIPVPAPSGGTLARLLVDEGDVISEGQDLAVIQT